MEKKIKITGMTCGHCQQHVTDLLKELHGVEKVEVSLKDSEANVSFNEGVISLEEIVQKVNDSQIYKAAI